MQSNVSKYNKSGPEKTDSSFDLFRHAEKLRLSNEPYKAIKAYKRFLKIEPTNYQALNNYGALLCSIGDNETSLEVLLRANKLLPNNHIILTNLGKTYAELQQPDKAIQLCQQALTVKPDFIDAYEVLGKVNTTIGNYGLAIESYNNILRRRPNDIRYIAALATALHYKGDNEEAYELISPSIREGYKEVAYIYFNIAAKLGIKESAVDYIKELLESVKEKSASELWRASLYFCLGKYYDSAAEYDIAIEYFHKANRHSGRKYNPAETLKGFDKIIDVFDGSEPASGQISVSISKQPIFVIGMPRSGTTLVEKILDAHPDVYGAGELNNIAVAAREAGRRLQSRDWPTATSRLKRDDLNRLANDYLEYIKSISGNAPRVVDKMPQNFMYLGFILKLFPDATIIHCQRHPLDTCLSCYFSHFGSEVHNYAYDLNALGSYYMQYLRLMKHWMNVLNKNIFQVRYEDIIVDHENTCKKLINACGLEWNTGCLEFYRNERKTHTLSYDQVNKPIYTHSVRRWKNYKSHIKTLTHMLDVPVAEYENQ